MEPEEPHRAAIRACFRRVLNFPKAGVPFLDISGLLSNAPAYAACVQLLVEQCRAANVGAIAAFEARGFFFGPPVALALGVPFVPLRKPRKLPAAVLAESYALEYGTDSLEIHADALTPGQRVFLVDDLLATGGTLAAGIRLVRRAGAEAVGCAVVIELPELQGRANLLGVPCFAVLEISGAPGARPLPPLVPPELCRPAA